MASRVVIRPAQRDELPAVAGLLRESLSFAGQDGIPAWFMATTTDAGGVVLVAVDGEALLGASYAFPGCRDGEPFLFSCGLAIRPERRGQGLGRALKREQGRRARIAGYRSIRWTASPLNVAALGLYLSGLGARLTGYRAALHDGLREGDGLPQDDVDIEWRLDRSPAIGRPPVEFVRLSELQSVDELLRVRGEMTRLLDAGFHGTALERDPDNRSRVRFERVRS